MSTVLYQYWRSSASWRVRWALAIKNIPFTSVPVDITKGEQSTADHRARNPIEHVPALQIDGRWLTESVAIFEYLEETRPQPALYPNDPWLRARVRQVVETINAGIQPLQNLIVLGRVSDDPEAKKAWAVFFNERGLLALERLLEEIAKDTGGGTFCVGHSLTAADVFLVPQIATARRFGIDLGRFPRALAAEKAALATPHADGALPERQPGAPSP
jgi:maleylacetoacetate isomerase